MLDVCPSLLSRAYTQSLPEEHGRGGVVEICADPASFLCFFQERILYEREGIELVESDFVDNSGCVSLLEERGWGVQSQLDETCMMPGGDDKAFLDRMSTNATVKQCPYWVQSKKRTDTFTIAHYAGSVTYNIEGFCERSRDQMPADVVELMLSSTNDFMVSIMKDAVPAETSPSGGKGGAMGKGKARGKSLSLKFKVR